MQPDTANARDADGCGTVGAPLCGTFWVGCVCARRAMLVRDTYYDSSGKEQLIGVMLNAMLCTERLGCDRNVPSGTGGSRYVLDGMVRATNCIFIATVRYADSRFYLNWPPAPA